MIYHSVERLDYCKGSSGLQVWTLVTEEAQSAAAGAPTSETRGELKVAPTHEQGKPPARCRRNKLAGDGFGDGLIRDCSAAVEEPAGGEELGVEQGGTGSAAD